MADSAVAKKDDKSVSGIDLIKSSKALFSNILYHFREIHDLCKQSHLYSDHSIIEIDTIAIAFRKLGRDTATVATVVSNQWLDSTIMFYQNIADFGADDLKSMLILLGGQAKELSKIFKVIAKWSAWMAAEFHDAQTDTVKDVKAFKDKFEKALKEAKKVEKAAEETVARAKNTLAEKRSEEEHWRVVAAATSWIPLVDIGTMIKYHATQEEYFDAEHAEDQAEDKLDAAKEKLSKAQTDNARAQVIHCMQ